MPSGELDTSDIVSEILKCGKQLFVPRIDKTTPGRMDFVRVYNAEDLGSSPAGLWGIKEPSTQFSGQPRANALDEGLDMILLPDRQVWPSTDLCQGLVMAKDTTTDTYPPTLRLAVPAHYSVSSQPPEGIRRKADGQIAVALSLREQMVEDDKPVPVDDTDWKVDMVVLPDETVVRAGYAAS
ncbi:hypothetical protein V5O48_005937 [Marasmius crinis-equi]|uniref:5-formyltetrahydrofolate cyclo-ligase n=1 Tax=Marasmius crinis-equi TaxID=585013 RepID=A0ABR3FLD5_9AGAR